MSSTAAAIYQEPKIFEAPPSRNIIIKTVMTTDGITRQFTTGELIINVPRKAWSAEGTDETPDVNRYAEPYGRRQTFQSNLEFGTQSHTASYTSQASMNRESIFKRTTPSIFSGRTDQLGRTPTGRAILPGQELKKPAFEGDYPPLMPGEQRPYNPEQSGLTRDFLYAEQQEQISERPNLWIRTGATVTGFPEIEQSPKGYNPYFFGGAGQMQTAGQAYYQGDKPLYTTKGNPYALGGAGTQITAGQAEEIEAILKERQERAREILAQMNTR